MSFRNSAVLLISAQSKKRTMRHRSAINDKRMSRNPHIQVGANDELTESKGHELEAFANFSVYKYNRENSPLVLHTNNLEDMPPKERLEAVLDIIQKRWKSKDSVAQLDRLQMCMQALDCFSDLCELQELPLSAFSEDYLSRFSEIVGCVCIMVQGLATTKPETVSALLYAADVCDKVGQGHYRTVCFERAEYLLVHDQRDTNPSESFAALFPEVQVDSSSPHFVGPPTVPLYDQAGQPLLKLR